MSLYKKIIYNLPEVAGPTQKRLSFKEKLKWTGMILVFYFVLSVIPLIGLQKSSSSYLETLSILFGASFGSFITLGIGPIVTASIVLQLLNGSGLWKFDLSSEEGKKMFQGTQKLLAIFFIIVEAMIYVTMNGVSAKPGFKLLVIIQMIIGGLIILMMDEVCQKWGFGSGVSLFIAAGVSRTIFLQLLNPFEIGGKLGLYRNGNPGGAVWNFFTKLAEGSKTALTSAITSLVMVVSTVAVFLGAVYMQAMKVEIPLSFGRVRGQGVRWPLNFLYTSNIPVILIAALLANIRLMGSLISGGGGAGGGFFRYMEGSNLLINVIRGSVSGVGHIVATIIIYVTIFMLGSMMFGWFWVKSSGMDAKSQAEQMMSSGLQIPGFRKDQRILERLLSRYITPLAIMGSLAIGLLAAVANLLGSAGTGTGILLTVMILYKMYEDIAQQHMMDMNPMMRKFMGGE